ncbi:MAG: glucose 1-dehydrogenase [Candidatus Latescibacteria bacterium]|nr:glucose 1-dehydrogenase [Candidatus Latescibacterota bacterium]
MDQLDGKVALITGSGSGMGRATASLFAREGARVVAVDIDAAGGQETVESIHQEGGEAIFVAADVARAADVKAMVANTVETYGQIDILHNNAGVVLVKFLEDTSEEEWDHLMGVNLKAIFLAVKYAVPHMKDQGHGCIINTGSTGSFVGQYMTPAYIASKGGVLQLTKTLALDYAGYNIRVNCICPGTVDTPMVRRHIETSPDPQRTEALERQLIPLKRFIEPDEIAGAALYLASPQARSITGTALVVDGGTLAGYVD